MPADTHSFRDPYITKNQKPQTPNPAHSTPQILRAKPALRTALAGVNAAVVGLLLAVFIDPVVTTSVLALSDLAIVLAGVALLAWRRLPVWLIVVLSAAAGTLLAA